MVTQNPSVNWLDVDPAQYTSRLAFLAGQIDAVNPDLSHFKARGGKLILWTGLTDWLITPHNATDYYTKVVEPQVARQMRMNSSSTSPPLALTIAVMRWVMARARTGQPGWADVRLDRKGSEAVERRHGGPQSNPLAGQTAKKRPLCKFPDYAKYNGTGDPNLAGSFSCVKP